MARVSRAFRLCSYSLLRVSVSAYGRDASGATERRRPGRVPVTWWKIDSPQELDECFDLDAAMMEET